MALVQLAQITSEGQPQEGQKHRSSGNFSTEGAPNGTTGYQWSVSNASNPGNVKFDVMEDKSAGIDPTIFSGVKDGTQTGTYSSRRLYIANPSGTNGGSFLVTVYAITP
jgi:hypothetical protein